MNARWTLWTLIALAALSTSTAQAQDNDPDEVSPKEFVPKEISPRTFSDQRRDNILLDSVVFEDSWWVHADVGASIYDPRRDVFIARWSPSLSVGRRFTYFGLFGAVQLDQSFDFTLDIDRLDVLNIGIGGEYLSFLGHVRSAITLGTSTLLSDTAIDEAGETGWFIEVSPGALRWAVSERFTLEFDPIALDLIIPVTAGIPLVVYSYSTFVGLEWHSK